MASKVFVTSKAHLVPLSLTTYSDSLPAPKFQIICSPNNWAKTMKGTDDDNLSETKLLQLEFWTEFNGYLQEIRSPLRSSDPQPHYWYDFNIEGIPRTQAYISLTVSPRSSFIRCEFYIRNNKELYHKMYKQKAEIEAELGYKLIWEEASEAKASSIYIMKENVRVKDRKTWQGSHKWLIEAASKFSEVFPKCY